MPGTVLSESLWAFKPSWEQVSWSEKIPLSCESKLLTRHSPRPGTAAPARCLLETVPRQSSETGANNEAEEDQFIFLSNQNIFRPELFPPLTVGGSNLWAHVDAGMFQSGPARPATSSCYSDQRLEGQTVRSQ